MTMPVIRHAAPLLTPQHASEAAYAAFVLEHHGSLGSRNYYLQIRREFVEAYPDLPTGCATSLLKSEALLGERKTC